VTSTVLTARGRGLLLVAVLLVALNLRGAIAAVSPVLPEIRADLGLSGPIAGLLTTLPVLCFAALAPAAAWLGRRIGTERAILLGTVVVAVGTVLRVLGGAPVLLVGTLLVGAAMTIGNVLVPVVVKQDFPERASTVTGLYTAALAAGAALTAALTAPIAAATNWRTGIAVWAALAVVAAFVWWFATRRGRHAGPAGVGAPAGTGIWRHPVAWALAIYLGCQSITFYTVTAWLPTMLMDDAALDLKTAGAAMSVFQVIGIAGTLVIPPLAGRRPSQGWLGLSIAGGWAVMFAGLLVWPTAWLAWSVVGGLVQGAGISLAFTLLVLRAYDTAAARGLSSMTQLIGYTLGASGPVLVGALYEVTSGWRVPLLVLLGVTAALAVAVAVAGRNVMIGAPQRAPVSR
jgi:CP family cyanate transporter-like MFS transporter